jgi:hypothetical protein
VRAKLKRCRWRPVVTRQLTQGRTVCRASEYRPEGCRGERDRSYGYRPSPPRTARIQLGRGGAAGTQQRPARLRSGLATPATRCMACDLIAQRLGRLDAPRRRRMVKRCGVLGHVTTSRSKNARRDSSESALGCACGATSPKRSTRVADRRSRPALIPDSNYRSQNTCWTHHETRSVNHLWEGRTHDCQRIPARTIVPT